MLFINPQYGDEQITEQKPIRNIFASELTSDLIATYSEINWRCKVPHNPEYQTPDDRHCCQSYQSIALKSELLLEKQN